MARLPIPGKDDGAWGQILNEYLSQSHDPSGDLKSNIISSSQLQDGAVNESSLSTAVQTKLNAPAEIVDNSIAKTKLAPVVQASLTKADSALQTAPVSTVNARTGDIILEKSDVGLANVDNTNDVNKPISAATQTALNNKVPRNLPSYAPSTASGVYQADKALYNVKPSNTRRMRVGLGRAGRQDYAATGQNYNELWIGDSIVGGCTGLGLGAGGTDRFDRINTVAQFHARALAAKTDIPAVGTGLVRIHDTSRFDSRFVLNTAATSVNTAVGGNVQLPPTGTITFTTNKPGNMIRVTYYDNFNSSTTGFKVALNGATSGVNYREVTGTSSSLWKSVLLTGVTIATNDTIVISGNTGTVVIGFVEVTVASGGIASHNLSSSGSNAVATAASGGGGYNFLRTIHEPGMLPFDYDVVHIAFGLFDATENPSNTTPYKNALTTLRNNFSNSDIVLHAMPIPGALRSTPDTWLQYVTATFEIADSLDLPLVDVQGLLGGYTIENALGLTADTTAHLSQTAYQMWGQAAASLIL